MKKAFQIRTASFPEVLEIEKLIPEFHEQTSEVEFQKRIGKEKSLILVLTVDSKPVAYKVGYAVNQDEFYSWLGAVIPEFRGRGYAQALLEYQESWAQSEGFRFISVKTSHDFPVMVQLLQANKYQMYSQITAVPGLKLLFRKLL